MDRSPIRRAWVKGSRDASEIAAYLPNNYAVAHSCPIKSDGWVIEGRDVAGWTLDGYVIPRLASGLIFATEITN